MQPHSSNEIQRLLIFGRQPRHASRHPTAVNTQLTRGAGRGYTQVMRGTATLTEGHDGKGFIHGSRGPRVHEAAPGSPLAARSLAGRQSAAPAAKIAADPSPSQPLWSGRLPNLSSRSFVSSAQRADGARPKPVTPPYAGPQTERLEGRQRSALVSGGSAYRAG